ncbi:MAG TPA: C39 family peptidase [Candidatus Paceibacterota bacterium]|nr:C39 family peptidase [Candidatus Paceibacterota bacterium]
MQLPVPFFSQQAGDIPEEWHSRACGVAALSMALAYAGADAPVPALIDEGVAAGAYRAGRGWQHAGLAELALRHGARAWRREYKWNGLARPFAMPFALSALRHALKRGIVPIVSLTTSTEDTHLVTLTGFGREGWRYNDPAKRSEREGKDLVMSTKEFARRFRKLAIFIARAA